MMMKVVMNNRVLPYSLSLALAFADTLDVIYVVVCQLLPFVRKK